MSGSTALLLAEAILTVHFGFILFVALGGLLAWRWPRLVWLHLPAVAWGGFVELSGTICPLTRWENHFLALAQTAGYDEGFVAHYLLPLIYPGLVLTPETARHIAIGAGLLALTWNAILYVLLWRRRRFSGRV